MRFLRRSLIGIFLLSVTLAVLAWSGQVFFAALQARNQDAPAGRPAQERVFAVNAITIQPQSITPVLQTFGEVQSRRSLEIRATAGGLVTWLSDAVEDGGVVAAGEVLARIDDSDQRAAVLVAQADNHEAEAELRDAERALEIAQDDLAAAQSQAELRAAALERQKSLQARGVVTDSAVEDAALTEASARQSVLSKRSALANAEARVDQANTGLLRAQITVTEAERALSDTEIVAGFDGTLSNVAITQGGIVTQNEQIATLIDPTSLEVTFRVSTQQYARLLDDSGRLIGSPIEVALDVSGVDVRTIGQITRESAEVGEGLTGRLLFARLDAPAGFRPGDFVTVSVEEPELTDVALVPATAVDSAGTVLVINADSRLELRDAPILRRQGDDVIIAAAALAEAQIVAERSPLLGAGIRVRVAEPLSATPAAATAPPAAETAEMIDLTDERRAALVAFVEGNTRMPAEAKARILAQLQEPKVSAETVARLETRMGG